MPARSSLFDGLGCTHEHPSSTDFLEFSVQHNALTTVCVFEQMTKGFGDFFGPKTQGKTDIDVLKKILVSPARTPAPPLVMLVKSIQCPFVLQCAPALLLTFASSSVQREDQFSAVMDALNKVVEQNKNDILEAERKADNNVRKLQREVNGYTNQVRDLEYQLIMAASEGNVSARVQATCTHAHACQHARTQTCLQANHHASHLNTPTRSEQSPSLRSSWRRSTTSRAHPQLPRPRNLIPRTIRSLASSLPTLATRGFLRQTRRGSTRQRRSTRSSGRSGRSGRRRLRVSNLARA
jgi:hypothetical protein